MVGVDLHASMLSNQQGGRIDAQAHVVRVGRRITVIRTSVTGIDAKLLAEVTTNSCADPNRYSELEVSGSESLVGNIDEQSLRRGTRDLERPRTILCLNRDSGKPPK